MKVTLGKDGLTKTWQAKFPETTECCRCKGEARIGFVAHEGMDAKDRKVPHVCRLHRNEGKGGYWLHDCACFAVYLCVNCLEPTVLCNQA